MQEAERASPQEVAVTNPNLRQRLRDWLAQRRRDVLADPHTDGADAWRFRAQQIEVVAQSLKYMFLGNVLTTLAVSIACWDVMSQAVLVSWAIVVLLALSGSHHFMHSMLLDGDAPLASERSFWLLCTYFGFYALLWITVPSWAFPLLGRTGELLIACAAAGVLCVGTFLLSPHAPAALVFMIVISIGATAGLLRSSLEQGYRILVLLLACGSTLAPIAWLNARVFLAGARAEAEKERQKQLVGLLLHDFEENASDWLWELSPQGRMRHVSARLAQSFGRPSEDLINLRLVDLLESMSEPDDALACAALEKLRTSMELAVPFRDMEVPVIVGGERRWWSLTAKPLITDRGRHGGWRGVGSDVTRERVARDELARLANYDVLTGLANRHLFSQQLEGLRRAFDQPPRFCSLIFMDLDNFKIVNDTLGHEAGDHLLRLVAKRLRERAQPGELLARLGGDEFAVLSWETTDPAAVAQRAQTLLNCLSEPCQLGDSRIEIRASIGIAMAPHDGDRPQTLLKSADLALYAAKSAGRNTWRFYDEEMAQRARDRLTLQQELRDAMLRGELDLYYQPQVDISSGVVSGFEALMRWRHPKRGFMGPADFVPLAEETGQIVAMGAWALKRACQEALSWPGSLRVAVNLSAVQFRSADIVQLVDQVLATTGLSAHRLELEITESALIEDNESALVTLRALRSRGVRVALDDFGTGYSSLAYLRTFPLDKLKIDGMFVRALDGEQDAREVVRAIISLARALRLDTTAEGVETPGQLNVLRTLGCRDVQGFLMSQPMAASEVVGYLHNRQAAGQLALEAAMGRLQPSGRAFETSQFPFLGRTDRA